VLDVCHWHTAPEPAGETPCITKSISGWYPDHPAA